MQASCPQCCPCSGVMALSPQRPRPATPRPPGAPRLPASMPPRRADDHPHRPPPPPESGRLSGKNFRRRPSRNANVHPLGRLSGEVFGRRPDRARKIAEVTAHNEKFFLYWHCDRSSRPTAAFSLPDASRSNRPQRISSAWSFNVFRGMPTRQRIINKSTKYVLLR